MATTEPRSQDFAASNRGDAPSNATEPVSIGGVGGSTNDPFAAQRTADNDPFANPQGGNDTPGNLGSSPPAGSPTSGGFPTDRRMSKEWDASKVPPSRFQRREGSIYATPGSRDAHTSKGRERDQAYRDKLKERVRCLPLQNVVLSMLTTLIIRAGNNKLLPWQGLVKPARNDGMFSILYLGKERVWGKKLYTRFKGKDFGNRG